MSYQVKIAHAPIPWAFRLVCYLRESKEEPKHQLDTYKRLVKLPIVPRLYPSKTPKGKLKYLLPICHSPTLTQNTVPLPACQSNEPSSNPFPFQNCLGGSLRSSYSNIHRASQRRCTIIPSLALGTYSRVKSCLSGRGRRGEVFCGGQLRGSWREGAC